MPELPEVETIRRGLAAHLVGARVSAVQVAAARAVRRDGGPGPVQAALVGATIEEVARRGKYLWLVTGDREAVVIHLGMSGQLLHRTDTPGALRHEAARVAHSHGTLVFVDQRTFGYLHADALVPAPDRYVGGAGTRLAAVPTAVAHIGRDLLDPALDIPAVVARMRRTRSAVKRVLLDQRYASGIGNIYADEALWRARVHPLSPAAALGSAALERLLVAARDVMREAVDAGGTSFDRLYVDTAGQAGYFARELAAYGRDGQPCLRCGDTMRRLVVGGRSSNVCLTCQEFVEGTA